MMVVRIFENHCRDATIDNLISLKCVRTFYKSVYDGVYIWRIQHLAGDSFGRQYFFLISANINLAAKFQIVCEHICQISRMAMPLRHAHSRTFARRPAFLCLHWQRRSIQIRLHFKSFFSFSSCNCPSAYLSSSPQTCYLEVSLQPVNCCCFTLVTFIATHALNTE